ncbi:hypothetical protein QVD17_36931 [Tagetes erecta]|uniref:Secreted protein n=1 Tax=Tagetes erecta TaxID=13708 RepID=A0AAD8JTC0_TARER|nr:hypothetical protein QVD17_36931 [Tagetes erecta]
MFPRPFWINLLTGLFGGGGVVVEDGGGGGSGGGGCSFSSSFFILSAHKPQSQTLGYVLANLAPTDPGIFRSL